MSNIKFSKDHEWIKLEGDTATIGITKHATEMLGDIVFAELPSKGSSLEKNKTAGVVDPSESQPIISFLKTNNYGRTI